MKHMIVWLFAMTLLLTVSEVVAQTQPTQQSNKIYLAPFYRESMVLNTNYTFNVTVNPPDGVSSIVSSIISFNGQINGQTQNFQMWVNGKTCNTANYTVATAFSTTGNVQFSFDCSNRITQAGTYNVTLRSSVNTGAMSGWLDLTYMNRPLGAAEVHGTEYVSGDPGTLFLLLKDSQGLPISNASCTVDIYYPNIANQTHPEWIDNGIMMYKEEGLYFYDFTAPAVVGLYMVSAQCRYSVSEKYYYTLSTGYGPTRNGTLGTFTGDTFVLNDYQEWLYAQCDSTTAGTKACEAIYSWIVDNTTYSSLSLLYLGESATAPTMTFSWWNWTSSAWVVLPNTLTFKGTAAGGVPSGVDEYISNAVPISAIGNTTREVRIKTYATAGSTFKVFSNWLTLKASQDTTTVQELKGSGEVHVSSQANQGETSKFLHIDTCTGFADGRCAYFTDDDEFNLQEGELEDSVNATAYASLAQQTLRYYTPYGVDCTALYWIKEWNGTSWEDFTAYEVYSQPAVQNCEVTITRDIVSGETYQYWFKYDNYMKWEVDWTKNVADTINKTVARICDGLQNYTLPIDDTVTLSNDTLKAYCYEVKDDMYWINNFYDLSLSVTLAGEYASYVQEMRWYRDALTQRYTWLTMENDLYPSAVDVRNWTNRTLALAQQINVTTMQINATVTSIKNDTSLLSQVWTWVQSILVWVNTDNDANASTAITTNTVNATIVVQTVSFLSADYYQQQASSVVAQVVKDGVSVAGAACTLNVYYPNMTLQVTDGGMSYLGADGLYNYTWTPVTYGSHLARVNCSGGTLTQQVQSSGSLGVSAPSTGVIMQSIG